MRVADRFREPPLEVIERDRVEGDIASRRLLSDRPRAPMAFDPAEQLVVLRRPAMPEVEREFHLTSRSPAQMRRAPTTFSSSTARTRSPTSNALAPIVHERPLRGQVPARVRPCPGRSSRRRWPRSRSSAGRRGGRPRRTGGGERPAPLRACVQGALPGCHGHRSPRLPDPGCATRRSSTRSTRESRSTQTAALAVLDR